MSKIELQLSPLSGMADVNPPVSVAGLPDDYGISFVSMADVSESGRLINKQQRLLSQVRVGFTRFMENDVLFAKITPCMENGKGALAKGLTNSLGFGSTEFHILRAKQGNSAEYIYQILQSQELRLKAKMRMTGSAGQQRVPSDFFDWYTAFAPVGAEQRKIARILSTVDSVIERTEAAIAKYSAIKQGMMHDLFTRGIDLKTGKLRPKYEDAPDLYRKSELGWVPKEWKVVQINSFCEIKGGKRLPAGSDFAEGETPYPYLRVTDMVDGTINQDNLKFTPIDLEPFIRPYKIYKSDIYVTIAGALLGKFGTIPSALDGAQLTENAARLTGYDEKLFERDFIKFQCNSFIIQNQIQLDRGVGGGVPKLALFRIGRFWFLKPDKIEQELIAAKIRCAERNLFSEQCGLRKYQSAKQALMSALLTGRKRVLFESAENKEAVV